ncbi:hypothetical protein [Plasmodium yoelii yoelii]|uniref:Uncharacterized protein n=1 Tax=Plasmodium yoelii yoelii TaxID=73239 RepID=Q7RJ47_PLAYO|nr:hypothetical protein [Plasmodium yoelii yoelii]
MIDEVSDVGMDLNGIKV